MTTSLLFLMALQLAGLLAECALGPDYKRPDLAVPGSYRHEVRDASDTANSEWWRQFEDPVLDALIAEALANNKNVRIAAAKVEQAAQYVEIAKAALLPAVNILGSGGTKKGGEDAVQILSLGVSWEIDVWGRPFWPQRRAGRLRLGAG